MSQPFEEVKILILDISKNGTGPPQNRFDFKYSCRGGKKFLLLILPSSMSLVKNQT